MIIHKVYQTEQEKQSIIATMTVRGFSQVSTDNYFIGEGHLLFDDGKPEPEPPRDLAAEIDELKARIVSTASGSYVGNASGGRQITTGFKCSLVTIFGGQYSHVWRITADKGIRQANGTDSSALQNTPSLHASDGFNVGAVTNQANGDTYTHYWWALSG